MEHLLDALEDAILEIIMFSVFTITVLATIALAKLHMAGTTLTLENARAVASVDVMKPIKNNNGVKSNSKYIGTMDSSGNPKFGQPFVVKSEIKVKVPFAGDVTMTEEGSGVNRRYFGEGYKYEEK